MYNRIYKGTFLCNKCGGEHYHVAIDDETVIKEFSCNYYIKPLTDGKCAWSEDDRYCVLVKWEDFEKEPEKYIDQAFEKRKCVIAEKVKVYPQ
jgi:hypothetical protein